MSTIDPAYTVHPCPAEVWAVQQRNGKIGRVVAWREVRFIEPDRLDAIHLDPVILWPGTIAASTGVYHGADQPELFATRTEAERAAQDVRDGARTA
jgi:hypothetical protein